MPENKNPGAHATPPPAARSLKEFKEPPHPLSRIGKVIGVVSGKGGVGKSLTSAMLAVTLQRRGYRVGILDADITGPSIPRLFGLHKPAQSHDGAIWPEVTKTGIQVMSVNLLLPSETDPVVWRGPVIGGTVKQFWQDVVWSDIECLVVDLPPGTGDVPLTVFQTMPVDGVFMVSTPQQLVNMVVAKAIKMAAMMQVPVMGLIKKHELCNLPRLR
ncbi:MAG: P-loop NTPase [Oscillospiraceae bacterium]